MLIYIKTQYKKVTILNQRLHENKMLCKTIRTRNVLDLVKCVRVVVKC